MKKSSESNTLAAVPVPFIYLNEETGNYEIGKEAKELLLNQKEPFGIISIVGKYRTGKSFFLNRCLLSSTIKKKSTQLKGFNVGNTVQACTKGLWIYTKPLYTHNDMPVYVIDTEGIASLDANSTHDSRIFALALLMSSFFIYNSLNAIDDEALNQLSLVTNICKQVRIYADKEATPEELGREIFPPLFWMVRDFSLQLKNENGQIMQPNEYLEFALQDSSKYEDKNQLRKCLKQCFPRRSCATLIRPCNDEYELQMLSSSNRSTELKPVFVQQLNWVRDYILKNIESKNSQGKIPMTGNSYLVFANELINSINLNLIPVIKSSWDLIAEIQCKEAIEETYKNVYLNHLKTNLNISSLNYSNTTITALQETHSSIKRQVMSYFRNENKTYLIQKSSGTTSMQKWENILLEKMDQDFERLSDEYKRLNELQIFNHLNSFDEVFLYDKQIIQIDLLKEKESQFFQLIEPIVSKPNLNTSETLLVQFAKKCFKWITHIVTLSKYFEQNYQKLENEKVELKNELDHQVKIIEKLREQYSELQKDSNAAITEKDCSIEILKSELNTLQEENAKWIDCFNSKEDNNEVIITNDSNDKILLDQIGSSNEYVSFNYEELKKQYDLLQEQLVESRKQFIDEIQDLKNEFDISMTETKQKYHEQFQNIQNELQNELEKKESLEKTIEMKNQQFQVLQEKLKTTEEKFNVFELNYKQQFEQLQKNFFIELNQQKNAYSELQQVRLDDQSKWLTQVRESDIKKASAEAESQKFKRKLEALTDPQKFKRLKTENQSLQQTIIQLTTTKSHLETTLQNEREKTLNLIAKHDDLLLKYHNLQREKEKSILNLTMDYERKLSSKAMLR